MLKQGASCKGRTINTEQQVKERGGKNGNEIL